eukprot:snap_masked-scaffold_51-processed-gene-1.12-mRNA-1 protein AED:0.18 eAED:0.18 QI:0/-1/0/1/-1/1/1/0/453
MIQRFRFAPSPTGALHLGGLRTALFNFKFAKKLENGKFMVRIEDTDFSRSTQTGREFLVTLKDTLSKFRLSFDENETLIQSERKSIYQEYANKLVEAGSAYVCFCKEKEKSCAKCTSLSKEVVESRRVTESYVIRHSMKHHAKEVIFKDYLRGEIQFHKKEFDDTVLIKSNSMATYHLASVVDDHLSNIKNIMRGEEWISSTPRHVLLYKDLFGSDSVPLFYHLPLLLNPDGKKLSKRRDNEIASVDALLGNGIIPETLIAFLEKDFENIFERRNMSGKIVDFDQLRQLNSSTMEECLEIENSYVMMNLNNWLNDNKVERTVKVDNVFKEISSRSFILDDYTRLSAPLLLKVDYNSEVATNFAQKIFVKDLQTEEKFFFQDFAQDLQNLCDFKESEIKKYIKQWNKKAKKRKLKFLPILRYILTAQPVGLPVEKVIYLLGKKDSAGRITEFFH